MAAQWFNGQLEIIGVHTFLPTLIDLLRDNQPMMEFVRQLVSSMLSDGTLRALTLLPALYYACKQGNKPSVFTPQQMTSK